MDLDEQREWIESYLLYLLLTYGNSEMLWEQLVGAKSRCTSLDPMPRDIKYNLVNRLVRSQFLERSSGGKFTWHISKKGLGFLGEKNGKD